MTRTWITIRLRTASLLLLLGSTVASAQPKPSPGPTAGSQATALPRKHVFSLEQLINRARTQYPGVRAAYHDLEAMERKLFQANWAWVPRGTVQGLFAPTPSIHCLGADGSRNIEQCVQTDVRDFSLKFSGVFGRVKLELGMPLYTFDKIGSAQRAARAGVAAKRAAITAAQGDVELNVVKAYWGVKLAREMLYSIREGRKHLDDAIERTEKQLDEGTGDATVTDLLRLKTHASQIDTRTVEARKVETLALATLATLTGQDRETFDVDAAVLAPIIATPLPLAAYLSIARRQRPEVKMLDAAALASKARVSLQRARFFPDLLLVGQAGIGRASNIDDPRNAFFNDPFNFTTGALGIALTWDIDTVQRYGELKEAAADARRVDAKRQEAMIGIEIEIQRAYHELDEALKDLKIAKNGQKSARSWLVATSQNLAAGLAEPKDLTDALVAYFTLKLRYLQAIFDANLGWAKLARASGSSVDKVQLATHN